MGVTPAELLFGRSLQTCLHKLYPNQSLVVEKEQRWQKEALDKGTRWSEFQKGEEVYVRNLRPGGVPWFPGRAAEITGPVSYRVFVLYVGATSSGGGMWIISGLDTIWNRQVLGLPCYPSL